LIIPELQPYNNIIVVLGIKNTSPEQRNKNTTDSNPGDVFKVSFL